MDYGNVPYDDDIFSVTKNTEKRIMKIAQDNNVKIDKPVNLNKRPFHRFKESPELGFWRRIYIVFHMKYIKMNLKK